MLRLTFYQYSFSYNKLFTHSTPIQSCYTTRYQFIMDRR